MVGKAIDCYHEGKLETLLHVPSSGIAVRSSLQQDPMHYVRTASKCLYNKEIYDVRTPYEAVVITSRQL